MFPKNKKHLEACFKVPKTLRLKYKKGKNRKRMSEHVKGSYISSEITNNSAVLMRESPTRSTHQLNEIVSENSHNPLWAKSITEFKDGTEFTEINCNSNVDTKGPCDGKIFCYKRKSLSTLINFKILSEKTFKSLRNEVDFMGRFENIEILNLSNYSTLSPVSSHFPKLLTSSFSDEASPKGNFICHCSLRNMKSDFRSTLELPQSLDFRSMNSLLKSVLDTKDIARAMKLCEKDLHFGTNLNSEVEGVIRIKLKELNGIKEFCCDVKYRAKSLENPHIIEDSELQEDTPSSSSMSEGVRPKNLNLFSKDCSESERRNSLKALCQLKLKSLDDKTWDIDEYLPSHIKKSSKTTHTQHVGEESTNSCSELTFSPESPGETCSDLKTQRTENSSMENKCQDLVEVKYIQLSMSIVLALVLHAVQSISQIMLEVFLVTDPPSPPW
ncbi:UNVERIFIED_CONTAM: hypothetical protein RMT77_005013 [Armadillidium vulgare]